MSTFHLSEYYTAHFRLVFFLLLPCLLTSNGLRQVTDDVVSPQFPQLVSEHPDGVAVVCRPVPQHLIARVGGVLGNKLVILPLVVAKLVRQRVSIFALEGLRQHGADVSHDGEFQSMYRTL